MFGAALLWSALPLIILLSSLANERIDDDLSRHIGLNGQGAHIVHSLFRGTPAHAVEPILTFALFSSVYFSPILISDSRTYGTIGVVFTLLTWFFLIGGVVVLGAVLGATWQAHSDGRRRRLRGAHLMRSGR
jgi:hypothetical protein